MGLFSIDILALDINIENQSPKEQMSLCTDKNLKMMRKDHGHKINLFIGSVCFFFFLPAAGLIEEPSQFFSPSKPQSHELK